jgi:hypothetical protein
VVTSSTVKATVGDPDQILFVHATGSPGTSDQALANYLITQGYNPVMIGANDSTTEDANGKALVIISSTVASGEVAEKFTSVTNPVVNWEAALQDNLLFTTDEDTVTRGVLGGQTQLEILEPTHPIATGLSGTVTVADAGVEFSWGVPAESATLIARLADGSERYGVYTYEPGDVLIDGATQAAGRRVHVPMGDGTYAGMNATGKQLIHNAINWALGVEPPMDAPSASITLSGGQVTISSSAGGTVQATDSLSPTNWTDIGPAPQTVPTSGQTRFFRVRR